MSLVTLAKYKEYLKIGSSDTTLDTQLTDMQSQVEKLTKECKEKQIKINEMDVQIKMKDAKITDLRKEK